MEEEIRQCLPETENVGGGATKKQEKIFLVIKIFYILILVMVIRPYTFVKIYRTA